MDMPATVMTCSTCILDFDDTLSATFEVRSRSLARAFDDLGYRVSHEAIEESWGAPFAKLIALLAPGVDLDLFLTRYREVMRDEPPLLTAGALDLLELLSARGVPRLVHSSSLTDLVVQDLDALGVSHLITMVFGSDMTEYSKPDPKSLDSVMAWLRNHYYGANEALYVGDSVNDMAVAKGCGISFIAVLTGRTSAEKFRAAGWDGPMVASLTELSYAQ